MWTLFVVTILPHIDDAKVVRYGEFRTEQACLIEQVILELEFENGEYASCHMTNKIIKR